MRTSNETIKNRIRDYARDGEIGASWYRDIHRSLSDFADAIGEDLETVVGVFAIVSPRMKVKANMQVACQLLTDHDNKPRGLIGERYRAARSWQAGHRGNGVPSGDKVGAFYRSIISAGDDTATTLDVWMNRALLDTEYGAPGSVTTASVYSRIESLFVEMEAETGLTSAQLQAAVWTGVRMEQGIQPDDVTTLSMLDLIDLSLVG